MDGSGPLEVFLSPHGTHLGKIAIENVAKLF